MYHLCSSCTFTTSLPSSLDSTCVWYMYGIGRRTHCTLILPQVLFIVHLVCIQHTAAAVPVIPVGLWSVEHMPCPAYWCIDLIWYTHKTYGRCCCPRILFQFVRDWYLLFVRYPGTYYMHIIYPGSKMHVINEQTRVNTGSVVPSLRNRVVSRSSWAMISHEYSVFCVLSSIIPIPQVPIGIVPS